jgi:cytochrome oxidase Cu insertion factor (SCO1/SenC/PrrC family)
MSQLNESLSDKEKAPATTGDQRGRPVRMVLGIALWTSALVMAFFVWKAAGKLRESMQARSQASAIQLPAEGEGADQVADAALRASSRTPSTASLWDPAGIKDFTFTERSGRKVTKADLLGHPWLISFIFTRCAGPCPRVSGRMAELQRQLAGTDVKLVTLTVDPDFDKPDVLNRYAQSFGADAKRWLYLTGDKDKTYRLINESFKMPVKEITGPEREPGYEVLHSVNILRVNEKGVVVAKYNALDDADVARLERDLAPYIQKAKAQRAAAPASAPGPRSPVAKGAQH